MQIKLILWLIGPTKLYIIIMWFLSWFYKDDHVHGKLCNAPVPLINEKWRYWEQYWKTPVLALNTTHVLKMRELGVYNDNEV